jgi:tungstate transport system substrate-binding protein
MYNNFVLLGPKSDPAGISGVDPAKSLAMIAAGKHTFLSRGDDSGTHQRELELWKLNGSRPDWPNYLEVGQGMGSTLMMADEKQAYVLSDIGTYLNFKEKIEIVPLSTESELLRNPYAVLAVNGSKSPLIQTKLANQFIEFLISKPTQAAIAGYQVAGQQLFYPTRLTERSEAGTESTGE